LKHQKKFTNRLPLPTLIHLANSKLANLLIGTALKLSSKTTDLMVEACKRHLTETKN
jgi:hypothetical protein